MDLIEACLRATNDRARPPVELDEKHLASVRDLLDAGADPDVADADGWTPLHICVMGAQPRLVALLLEAGAAREGRLLGQEGGTPLALALFYPNREIARLLAPPFLPDNLRTAAALGEPIERFVTPDGALTADAGAGRGFYRPLRLFPEWEPSGDRQEILDEALCWAAKNGQVASMERLVALGADVNANPYRGTPLLCAAFQDQVDAAAWLLDHGADPDLRHDFGGAEHGRRAVAMHLAAQFASLRTLELLLERGADPTLRDASFDATPLGWALHVGAEASVEVLRRHGVSG